MKNVYSALYTGSLSLMATGGPEESLSDTVRQRYAHISNAHPQFLNCIVFKYSIIFCAASWGDNTVVSMRNSGFSGTS